MKRSFVILALALVNVLLLSALPANAEDLHASVTLVKPSGSYQASGSPPIASIPFESKDHYVEITGAQPNQWFNVQWSIQFELNGGIVPGGDYGTNYLARCDAMGNWKRMANGTGILNGTYQAGPGTATARGYSDLVNNATGQSRTAAHSRQITISPL